MGIGGINSAVLQMIATTPDFFIGVSDFNTLDQSLQLIINDICAVVSIPTPTATATPTSTATALATPVLSLTATPSSTATTFPTPGPVVDACVEAFAACGLTFKKKTDLQTFNILKKSGNRFTNVIVDKKTYRPPGMLHAKKLHALHGKCLKVELKFHRKKKCIVFRIA